jgi:hypothetical protein
MDLSTVQVSFKDAAGVVQQSRLAVVEAGVLVAGRPWRVFRWHRGQAHYSGWYWSATMGRHVVYESRLELARLLLADFDRQVAAIAAQPLLVTAPAVDGRTRRHGVHPGADRRLRRPQVRERARGVEQLTTQGCGASAPPCRWWAGPRHETRLIKGCVRLGQVM